MKEVISTPNAPAAVGQGGLAARYSCELLRSRRFFDLFRDKERFLIAFIRFGGYNIEVYKTII